MPVAQAKPLGADPCRLSGGKRSAGASAGIVDGGPSLGSLIPQLKRTALRVARCALGVSFYHLPVDRLDTGLVDALRAVSKTAFGHEMRLAICVLVARHEVDAFSQTELLDALGIRSPSAIARPLRSLVEMGALEPCTTQDGRGFRRLDTILWSYAEELLQHHLRRPSEDLLF